MSSDKQMKLANDSAKGQVKLDVHRWTERMKPISARKVFYVYDTTTETVESVLDSLDSINKTEKGKDSTNETAKPGLLQDNGKDCFDLLALDAEKQALMEQGRNITADTPDSDGSDSTIIDFDILL